MVTCPEEKDRCHRGPLHRSSRSWLVERGAVEGHRSGALCGRISGVGDRAGVAVLSVPRRGHRYGRRRGSTAKPQVGSPNLTFPSSWFLGLGFLSESKFVFIHSLFFTFPTGSTQLDVRNLAPIPLLDSLDRSRCKSVGIYFLFRINNLESHRSGEEKRMGQ